jgi:phage terminase small subunit
MNEKEMNLREEIAALHLTERQKAFCESYLEDFDASKAMKRIGYKGKNAGVMGAQHLASDTVQAYLAILKREIASRINLRLEDVMREYMRVGFARIDDIATWDKGVIKLKKFNDLSPDQLSAIASVENTREGIKIKMHGKLDALSKLKEFCEERPAAKTPSGPTQINIGEVRVALGNAETRKALDQVASAFLGKRQKALEYLDEHIKKVTDEIIKPGS